MLMLNDGNGTFRHYFYSANIRRDHRRQISGNIFDKIAQKCGAGTFVPISGFANALTSSALECKSEGIIYGIGSNMFKLAGSVITYGIVSAYLLGIVRYVVYVIGGVF
jgi:hypothetical protein